MPTAAPMATTATVEAATATEADVAVTPLAVALETTVVASVEDSAAFSIVFCKFSLLPE